MPCPSCLGRPEFPEHERPSTVVFLRPVQEVGQKIKDALHAHNAAPVVVELDWKESVLHEDDRWVAYTPAIA